MKKKILPFLFFIVGIGCLQGQTGENKVLSHEIKTIETTVNGDKNKAPIIKLNSKEEIQISFDRISDNLFGKLRYSIKHCDANWNTSKEISETDYLNGFNDNLIEDYRPSINTTVAYTHFNLFLPNNDVELKLSGNYRVEVYDEEEPDKILFHICFSIIEPLVNIGCAITANTDIDTNKEHQQVSLDILYPNLNVRDAVNDFKIFVLQNNRPDTKRIVSNPSMIAANKISFNHNKDLIFEAGNEYRRFETSSHRSRGMNVMNIEYQRPYYLMDIQYDKIRAKRTYIYDQDQDGRYYIRNRESNNNETEADYIFTNFSIPINEALPYSIYINGDFTYHSFSDEYKMKYDDQNKKYALEILLKQGLYNYQYLAIINDKPSTSLVEGNYYNTENEYIVYVYYKPIGQRYDRLVGNIAVLSRAR